MTNSRGITLIEVLIAMVLLVFISIGTYTLTTKSTKLRDEIEDEGDFINNFRAGLDQLERDILHMYSPPQPKFDMKSLFGFGGPLKSGEKSQEDLDSDDSDSLVKPSNFWGLILKNGVRVSRFQGSPDRMSFIANSHIKLYEDVLETDLVKIIYTLHEDEKNSKDENTSYLQKTFYTNVFSEQEKDAEAVSYPIIFNIKGFKFAYYDRVKDQWQNEWDSASMENPNPFPTSIRVDVTVESPNERIGSISMRRYFNTLSDLNEARRVDNAVQNPSNFLAK